MYTHPACTAVASLVILLLGVVFLGTRLGARRRRKGDNDSPEHGNRGSDLSDHADSLQQDIDVNYDDVDVTKGGAAVYDHEVDATQENIDANFHEVDATQEDIDANFNDFDTQRININSHFGSQSDLGNMNWESYGSMTTLTDSIVAKSDSESGIFRERSSSDVTGWMTRRYRGDDVWFHNRSYESLTSMLSSSCPTLNAPIRSLAVKFLSDEGHPKSMENLAEDNLTSLPHLDTNQPSGLDDVDGATSPRTRMFKDEYVDEDSPPGDGTETVDSSEDFLQTSEDSSPDSEDSDERRESWTSEELGLHSDVISASSLKEENPDYYSLTSDFEYLQTYNQPLGRRSYSLTSLLEEEETEETPASSYSKKHRLIQFSLDTQTQVPPDRTDGASSASGEDFTDSGSGSEALTGSEALSPAEENPPENDYIYHTNNDLPQSIGDSGYLDDVLQNEASVHSSTSSALYATGGTEEHKPHKARLRNDRVHSSMSGMDAMLYKPGPRHGVTRKTSFMNLLRGQQKPGKVKHRETGSTDQPRSAPLSMTTDTNCDGGHQLLPSNMTVPCENCVGSQHGASCTEQLAPYDKSGPSAGNYSLGSTQWNHESLHHSSLSTPGVTQWRDQTMREHRPTDIVSSRQTTQNAAGPHTQPTPAISGMTKVTSESLETTDGVIAWLNEGPGLELADEELSDHIRTADTANVKKLTEKDERQSRIRELINTEKHYVNRLKIMQKVFAHSMITKLKYTEDQVNKLFPGIDELVEIHEKFLHRLLGRQSTDGDKFVQEIGDILLDQFQGEAGDKMISVYGVFFCKYKEAMQLYKEFLKNDRNFQMFVKYCHSLPACEKREIPDFCLGVTIRLSKYWILIEGILKKTKDKKERKLLDQAVKASKNVLLQMDKKVDAYDKLIHIQRGMDSKTVMFQDKRFKRQDLNANNRELVHAGIIGWMSAQGRIAEILAIVLTDIIVFLQRNEQKYTFFVQDKKSCVIPLHDLLVREKGDVKGSLGIYVISQNPAEMYELVCKSKREREEWIRILQHAVKACRRDVGSTPAQAERNEVILSKPVDISRKLEVASKVTSIIKELHQKDEVIRECCDDKNRLMLELLQLSTVNSEAGSRPGSQEIDGLHESVEILLAAMQEASRLTGILQNTDSNMGRSISVGEPRSESHMTASVPRRSETFSGFDSSYGTSKILIRNQTNASSESSEIQEVKDRRYSDTPDTILESKDEHRSQSLEKKVSCDTSSDHGSVDELSAANILSLMCTPSIDDQMASVFHLAQYLNSLMNITSRQCTMVESLRAELEGAKEEISRLSADVHSRQSTLYRHDQMEELRQLQGNLTLEKQAWEKRKNYDCSHLQIERENLETERRQIEKDKVNLRNEQEALRRERDLLHNEFHRMKQQFLPVARTVDNRFNGSGLQNVDGGQPVLQQRHLGHHRSASDARYDTVTDRASESYSPYAWVRADEFPYEPLESVESPENYVSSSVRQDIFPFYFEEGVAGVGHQNLPLTTETIPFQNQESAAVSSPRAYVPYSSFSRQNSTRLSRNQSLSTVSRIRRNRDNGGSSDTFKKDKFSEQPRKP